MPATITPSPLPRLFRWAVAIPTACLIFAAGCQTPGVRSVASRPAAPVQPAPVVLYPRHAAPGRVLALRPITGTPAEIRPPGPALRAITGVTTQPSPVSQLSRPLSLAVRAGKILVCDTGRRALVQIDPRTGSLELVELHALIGSLDPVAVAVDGQGNAYVADALGKRVLQVSETNGVLRTYALAADAPFVPIDVAVSAERVYVVNRAARQVEVFELATAKYLGPFGNPEQAKANFPVAVTVDAQGRVYVVDMTAGRVRVYDAGGQMLREIGGPGDRPGLFAQPRSVAVGPDAVIYVSDTTTQVVQMFNAAGELLMYFGGADGSIGQMGMPARVITDQTLTKVFASQIPPGFEPKYMIFVAEQVGPGRIGVYAFGQLASGQEASQP